MSAIAQQDSEKCLDDLLSAYRYPSEALEELERRRKDTSLKKNIEEYLNGDIPEYFKNGPILYLARYIVTPNFETLRFIHLISSLGLKVIASHDSEGLFVSRNRTKRALCKLPICMRITQKDGRLFEQYKNVNIADFNSIEGKPFSKIQTIWNEPIIQFHARLFEDLGFKQIEQWDDSSWIDRHHRNNLFEHYKHLMALFIVHGIFFENYDLNDPREVTFVKNIILPTSVYLEQKFGLRPIIAPLYPTAAESNMFWFSYPRQTLDIVRRSIQGGHLTIHKY